MRINRVIGIASLTAALAASSCYWRAKPGLTFRTVHTGPVLFYKYKHEGVQKTIVAPPGFELLEVDFSISNDFNAALKFSSEQILVRDKDGNVVKAHLIGVGDNIVEGITTMSLSDRVHHSNSAEIAKYEQKLSASALTMNWSLEPRTSYSEALILAVPEAVEGLSVNLEL